MPESPHVVARAHVAAVERLSPSYVRVELGSAELVDLADGPWHDQRIKLVFPTADGVLPPVIAPHDDWFGFWADLPEERRGVMRSYSVRDVRGSGSDRRLVVDFVLHLEPGATGPASTWAAAAQAGSELVLVGPRRGHDVGGIEFRPGTAEEILLVADETAVPAACRILDDLPAGARGAAFFEVPEGADVLVTRELAGLPVTWLARTGRGHGVPLVDAVLDHLGASAAEPGSPDGGELIWEVPAEPASGAPAGVARPDLYAWIAGESSVVTALRRHLVRGGQVDRHQVAFMGYWRRGVAMRS